MSEKTTKWIDDYVSATQAMVTAMEHLKALKAEYDALDYGNVLVDADFSSRPAVVTKAQFVDAVSSIGAIDTWITSNWHWTNLYRIFVRS